MSDFLGQILDGPTSLSRALLFTPETYDVALDLLESILVFQTDTLFFRIASFQKMGLACRKDWTRITRISM